ncbi:MAG: hypothetical protein RI893_594 [Pseudomonadota bacterium]|jgi:uncharacterized coiled-coil DUF342 family protein
MIDIEENTVIPEIEQELALINQETQDLENDLRAFKSIHEDLNLLRSENEELKKRISIAETNDESFRKMIKKRDEYFIRLHDEIKKLHANIRDIRNTINPS